MDQPAATLSDISRLLRQWSETKNIEPLSAARVGERDGIIPAVRGSAWSTGLHQYRVDPTDPFPEGYLVPDTWGVSGSDTQV